MLRWALVFLTVALISAVFGFTAAAAGAAEVLQLLFLVFLVLFVVSRVAVGFPDRRPH